MLTSHIRLLSWDYKSLFNTTDGWRHTVLLMLNKLNTVEQVVFLFSLLQYTE
jgi:hypothetical protein